MFSQLNFLTCKDILILINNLYLFRYPEKLLSSANGQNVFNVINTFFFSFLNIAHLSPGERNIKIFLILTMVETKTFFIKILYQESLGTY